MASMTFDQLSAWAAALPARLEAAVIKAETKTLVEANAKADELSNGIYSTAELRLMHSPYAIRDPRPPDDPEIINNQSGDFAAGWRKIPPQVQGNEVISSLVNIDPKASLVEGRNANNPNSLMMPRPIVKAIQAAVEPARRKRLEKAFREVLTPK